MATNKKIVTTTRTSSTVPSKRRPKQKNPRQGQVKRTKKKTDRSDQVRTMAQRVHLKPCTFRYFKCLTDPWAAYGRMQDVCVPDLYDLPSFKFTTRIRGTLAVGTSGFGYIILAPQLDGASAAIGAYTGAAFTSANTFANSGVGVTTLTESSYPYNQITGAYKPPQARLVAAGVRIRYTGTELNRAGNLVPFFLPSTGSIGGATTAQLMSIQNLRSLPNNRQWIPAVFNPSSPSDYTYANYTAAQDFAVQGANMGVAIMGDPTVGNTYEFDVLRFWEVVPTLFAQGQVSGTFSATYATTKSDSDLEGLSFVKDFMGQISPSDAGDSLWSAALKYMKDHGVEIAQGAYKVGKPLLMNGI